MDWYIKIKVPVLLNLWSVSGGCPCTCAIRLAPMMKSQLTSYVCEGAGYLYSCPQGCCSIRHVFGLTVTCCRIRPQSSWMDFTQVSIHASAISSGYKIICYVRSLVISEMSSLRKSSEVISKARDVLSVVTTNWLNTIWFYYDTIYKSTTQTLLYVYQCGLDHP